MRTLHDGSSLFHKIEQMLDDLDEIQELDQCQDDSELMWEIGEAIGSLNNALDIIENKKLF